MKKLTFAACLSAASLVLASGVAQGQTLQKVKETGAITLGVREASIPMSFLDDKQQFVGYHIDVCNKIVDAVKAQLKLPALKVNLQPVTSANRIPLLTNGTIDLECGSTTNSVERQKQVAFVLTTFITDVRILTKVSTNVKKLEDLHTKPIAVTSGTTSVQLIRKQEKGKTLELKEVFGKDHAESFLLLDTDRAAAFALDDYLLAGFRANSAHPQDFTFLPEVLSTEPIAIMLRKDDPEFKKLADDTVRVLIKSGELEKLYAKWFLSPIPPKGGVLNMPISSNLKAQFANPTDKGI